MVLHHGGSRSAHLHALDLVKETGILYDKATYQICQRFHVKNGKYSDGRSQRILEEVERRVALLREPFSGSIAERERSCLRRSKGFSVRSCGLIRRAGFRPRMSEPDVHRGSSSESAATSSFNSAAVD